MMISLSGVSPNFELPGTNFTQALANTPSCLAWYTMQRSSFELEDEKVMRIRPRVGDHTLEQDPGADGAEITEWNALSGLSHKSDILDSFLVAFEHLDPSSFSIASVMSQEAGVTTLQRGFSFAGARRNLRMEKHGGVYSVKEGVQTILSTDDAFQKSAPTLLIFGLENDQANLLVKTGSETRFFDQAEHECKINHPATLVLGAEHETLGTDGTLPNPARSWRGSSFEFMAFDRNILGEAHTETAAVCEAYFDKVYGGST